jgi:hypothetical protein
MAGASEPRDSTTVSARRPKPSLTQLVLWLSGSCLAVDLLIAASTLAPGAPLLAQWPEFVLFPLAIIVNFSSVMYLRRYSGRRGRVRWREFVEGLPRELVISFVVLFAVAWLVGLDSITSIGGQPTISGGRYYLNDHGTLTQVTRPAYQHALVLQQRIFTLIPSVFFALAVLAHYPRREAGPTPGPIAGRPQPTRHVNR